MSTHQLPTEVLIKLEYAPGTDEGIKVSRYDPEEYGYIHKTEVFAWLIPPANDEIRINNNGCVMMSRATLDKIYRLV